MATGSENMPPPHGYEYELVSPVEKRLLCPICELPFKDAVQTKCGHKFCRRCLIESLRRFNNSCPLDRQQLDLETDVFEDVSTQREIMDLHIRCASDGCDWVGELRHAETHPEKCTNNSCQMKIPKRHMENHVKNECEWRIMCCSYCGAEKLKREEETHHQECDRFPIKCVNGCGIVMIPRCEMQDHVDDSCALTLLPCSFRYIGCNEKIERRDFEQHMECGVGGHLRLACNKLVKLEHEQREEIKSKIEQTLLPLQRWKDEIWYKISEDKVNQHNIQENVILKLQQHIEKIQNEHREEMNEVKRRCDDLKRQTDELKKERQLVPNMTFWIITVVIILCATATWYCCSSEMQARNEVVKQTRDEQDTLSAMCTCNKFIWPIRSFRDLQARDSNVYSSPFYSWDHGYKLKLRVFPNGEGTGKGTHLSVSVVVAKGDYDAILPWPFNRRVKITLFSQQQDKKDHLAYTLDFRKATSKSSERPSTDRRNGWVIDKFISHEDLKNSPHLVGDTIFLQAQVLK